MTRAHERLVAIGDDASLMEAARDLGHGDTDIVVVCGPRGALAGVVTKTVVGRIVGCQLTGAPSVARSCRFG
jgi:CBS domain-containing protein